MKFIAAFVFMSLSCMYQPCAAQQAQDMDTLARYITDRQLRADTSGANGAIWSYMYADTINNDTVYKVVPYFAHYAARGLLKCGKPIYNSAVKSWVNWYLSHLDSIGRMATHYYVSGSTADSIVDPNDNDAQDADPAIFWVLAWEYSVVTGDRAFFTPAVKQKLEAQAKFIIENLMDADNLTFANINFAMKYTVNNSEVYQGFMTLANIERDIYHDNANSAIYRTRAAGMPAAIRLRLYDPVSGLYKNNTNNNTNAKSWYDLGIVQALWPQFCGVDGFKDDRSVHQRDVLCQNFSDKNEKDWTSPEFIVNGVYNFPSAVVGYIFSLAGDVARGHRQLEYIVPMFRDPAVSGHLNIEEAGWCLMNFATAKK